MREPEAQDPPPAEDVEARHGDVASEMDPGSARTAPDHEVTPEELDEKAAELDLDRELRHLQGELTDVNDRHLRLAAEFENFRKRAQGEMAETWARAQADLVRRLLDSLDDLQRVTDQDPQTVSSADVLEGVELIERKIFRGLEESGVEVINPVDQTFDPRTMEAVMRVPAESEDLEDTVQDVFQKGYMLKTHLVRPARVTVRTSA